MDHAGIKVYIGNVEGVSEDELRTETEKYGRVENIWIARNPPGFAFCWYNDQRDADDAVRALDGKLLHGKALRVEVSHNRGGRRDYNDRDRGGGYGGDRGYGRAPMPMRGGPPRKTGYKVRVTNLPVGTPWTALKDYMRKVGEVIYTNVDGDEGIAEFADREGMEKAARELDDCNFEGARIRVDVQDESDRFRRDSRDRSPPRRGGRDRSPYRGRERSRSPPRRRSRTPPRRRSRSPR